MTHLEKKEDFEKLTNKGIRISWTRHESWGEYKESSFIPEHNFLNLNQFIN